MLAALWLCLSTMVAQLQLTSAVYHDHYLINQYIRQNTLKQVVSFNN